LMRYLDFERPEGGGLSVLEDPDIAILNFPFLPQKCQL
jgi:hypothetical protein